MHTRTYTYIGDWYLEPLLRCMASSELSGGEPLASETNARKCLSKEGNKLLLTDKQEMHQETSKECFHERTSYSANGLKALYGFHCCQQSAANLQITVHCLHTYST